MTAMLATVPTSFFPRSRVPPQRSRQVVRWPGITWLPPPGRPRVKLHRQTTTPHRRCEGAPLSTRKPDVNAVAVDALLRTVFGTSVPVTCQRTPDGVSTQVYRIRRGSETFYLRIAEEADENLETDAELHQRLRDLGVGVARVIHVEPRNAEINRSAMITTEVPGAPLADNASPAVAATVVERAGADLALLNQVPVDGFGWVQRRGRRWPLRAEHASYPPFLTAYLPSPWPGPLTALFATPTLDAIEDLIEHERHQPPASGLLAHGDFDVTQIFCVGGRYTGLIDFGEIRGADPLFDLGHFHLHDRELTGPARLPALLTGYQRVRPLPAGHEQAIRRSGILLGLRQLCRWLGPLRGYPPHHPAVLRRAERINQLVAAPGVAAAAPPASGPVAAAPPAPASGGQGTRPDW